VTTSGNLKWAESTEDANMLLIFNRSGASPANVEFVRIVPKSKL
jgi:hypothetical protein